MHARSSRGKRKQTPQPTGADYLEARMEVAEAGVKVAPATELLRRRARRRALVLLKTRLSTAKTRGERDAILMKMRRIIHQ